jgi:hypothetical protein
MDVRGPNRAVGRRVLAAMVGACAAGAMCVPAAGAATLTNEHGLLETSGPATYTAGAGEANRLALRGSASAILFRDPGATITRAEPDPLLFANDCTVTAPTSATCPLTAVTAVTALLGDGDDTVFPGGGLPTPTIDGGPGTDLIDYSTRTVPVAVDLNAGTGTDAASITGVEEARGGSAADALTGNGQPNRLFGLDGPDALTGLGGVDRLDGGPGADSIDAGPGDDTLVGGEGVDTFGGGTGDDLISAADGVAEDVSCGPGADTVLADVGLNGVRDRVAADCETVTGETPASTTSTPAQTVAGGRPAAAPAALVSVLAPGIANPADLTPPAAALRAFTRQRVRTVLARGLPVRVTCAESCGISIALAIDRTAARRLGLAGRSGPAIVGTAAARRSKPGANTIRVKVSRRARTVLRRQKRVTVAVQALVSDASGNGTLLQRRVTLVR